MKKGLVFFLGVLTGAVLATMILCIIDLRMQNKQNQSQNLVIFEQPGDTVPFRSLKITQVRSDGSAFAKGIEKADARDNDFYDAVRVLLPPVENMAYYDDMIIHVSKEKTLRLVGTYRYMDKTLPVVAAYEE